MYGMMMYAADKCRGLWNRSRSKVTEDKGMGTVEVILIIVVLVGLVLIFKSQLTNIVNSLFSKISSQADSV